MNRSRANPAADRAAQNAQTLKALVKLEYNKTCADCKRNKHPRWASWNLGVFVCIRCSGIHRGMGTHISRVKSVDLDAWTDEQLQSVIKWGNARANKYWEAKLAPGHVPSETKIENFIRTKYESKRWVMDGPMPDPLTLGSDDEVPLNIVQEKAKIERSVSQRQMPLGKPPPPAARAVPPANVNLFDDFEPPVRPNTADVLSTRPVQAAQVASPQAARPTKAVDSFMGLDFFGASQPAGVGRPSSAASNPTPTTNARGDLKNSILSLYASSPKPQPTAQPAQTRQPSFGGMTSTPAAQNDAFGGLTDAFSGLSFPNPSTSKPPPPQTQSSSFSGLNFSSGVPAKASPVAAQVTSPPPLSGGSFFDTLPAKPAQPANPAPTARPSSGLDFSFTQKATPPPVTKPAAVPSSFDLFADDGFNAFSSAPTAATTSSAMAKTASPPPPPVSTYTTTPSSVFNLSSPTTTAAKPTPAATARTAAPAQTSNVLFNTWASPDDNAWAAPEPAPPKPAQSSLGTVPDKITPNDIRGGWAEPISTAVSSKPTTKPTVTADDDFGGWESGSAAQTPAATTSSKPATGGFGTIDPFDNPW